jgi:hypothetical protein
MRIRPILFETTLAVYGDELCFHGGNYEEFHLPGYENPVRTSNEIRVS